MKTSKYFIIAFLVFIFGAVTVLFVSSKFHENENPTVKILKEELGSFSVIVAGEGAKIGLTSDSVFFIKVTLYEDSVFEFPDYLLENDTLFISSTSHRYYYPYIHCGPLTSVIGKVGSNIQFRDYFADSISINVTNSNVRGNFEWQNIDELKVRATQNSEINFTQSHYNTVQLSLDHSKARIYNNTIKQLNAQMVNDSDLLTSNVGVINLDTDSTSTYNVYKRQ